MTDFQSTLIGDRRENRKPVNIIRSATLLLLAGLATHQVQGGDLVRQGLHDFNYGASGPAGGLIQTSDGGFYGIREAIFRGSGATSVYRVTADGLGAILGGPGGGILPASFVQGNNGNFYGLRSGAFAEGIGSLFQMTPDGQSTTLVSFTGPNGAAPSSLIRGQDGNLYGTTLAGGTTDQGTVFSLAPDGTLTTLHAFDGVEGGAPNLLLQGNNGNLHGIITTYATSPPQWRLFTMTLDGATAITARIDMSGFEPNSLIQASDGSFYATTSQDGAEHGTVHRITPGGTATRFVTLDGKDEEQPRQIIQAPNGAFYVLTSRRILQMTPTGASTPIITFDGLNGEDPTGLIQGRDQNLYGTTRGGGAFFRGTLFRLSPGDTPTTLSSFPVPEEGSRPANLVEGKDGNFYGTTLNPATIFRVAPNGTLGTLARSGTADISSLVAARDGDLYGTYESTGLNGVGSVFKMNTDGTLTSLASFDRTISGYPKEMVQGLDGAFYIVTSGGLTEDSGTVSTYSKDGVLRRLASFEAATGSPTHLIQGQNGDWYGITTPPLGHRAVSTVFRMSASGLLETQATMDRADGAVLTGLIQGRNGSFYGTISPGLTPLGKPGAVFKMTPEGLLTILFQFDGTNGSNPSALIEGTDGNLYGLTGGSETDSSGSLFRLSPAGEMTPIMSFNYTDRGVPDRLIQGSDGNIYGSTSVSPGFGGAIFRLVRPTILHAARPANLKTALSWNSFPHGAYRVEFKSRLADPDWNLLTPEIMATGDTTSVIDDTAVGTERYFRVRLLP